MSTPHYKQLIKWNREYSLACPHDKQAVEVYVECETHEAIVRLRNELLNIKSGGYSEEILAEQLGSKGQMRLNRHESFSNWAGLMLQWLNFYKNRV
ncbi:MAG: hypothetical protein R3A13_05040 [Bdellovibrionota bacterium]